ncbi:MAG: hypothetical protein QM817_00305 [Archangium sp.]
MQTESIVVFAGIVAVLIAVGISGRVAGWPMQRVKIAITATGCVLLLAASFFVPDEFVHTLMRAFSFAMFLSTGIQLSPSLMKLLTSRS